MTNYTAGQTNQNEDKWLNEQNQLYNDQLAGTNSEAGVYSTQMGGSNNSLNDLTSRQNTNEQTNAQMAVAGMSAIGGAVGGM